MSTWHRRMFPYPLLAPWTDDYDENSDFAADVPAAVLNNGRQIKVGIAFRLLSAALHRLIDNGKAGYAVDISCPRTFVGTTHMTEEHQTLVLDAGDYDEELKLTPYVVSKGEIEGFRSAEHAPEWRAHRPGGFNVPAAGILAVGDATRITLEDSAVNSVIDLVSNPGVPDGSFTVELDDDRIKIHVPEAEKARIEAVRNRRTSVEFAALYPGLYLHAVVEAIRNLPDHGSTRWAFTIRSALDRTGHGNVDNEVLQSDALRFAQILMDQPVGGFLAEALRSDGEDQAP